MPQLTNHNCVFQRAMQQLRVLALPLVTIGHIHYLGVQIFSLHAKVGVNDVQAHQQPCDHCSLLLHHQSIGLIELTGVGISQSLSPITDNPLLYNHSTSIL